MRVFLTQALETEMNKAGACPPGLTASQGDKTGRHLIRISAKRAEMHEQLWELSRVNSAHLGDIGSRCRIWALKGEQDIMGWVIIGSGRTF